MKDIFKNLIIFEIANNHMGDISHGLDIIEKFGKISEISNSISKYFQFAFKLQYRDMATFVHPDYQDKSDKYPLIKRFTDTNLTAGEYKILKDKAKELGFITICTPFDEKSVELVIEHDYDIIKVASCSFADWSLLEKIVQYDKPIILSTGGATLEEIDRVVMFLKHRKKEFCLMHCVGEYPTNYDNLQLNQIDLFKKRYEGIPIGYSTHEDPDELNAVKIAIAKGASVFERHVGLYNLEKVYHLNKYSSAPGHIHNWLHAMLLAKEICGVENTRRDFSEQEIKDLNNIRRALFAKVPLKNGELITEDKIFRAIPKQENQLLSKDFSKYSKLVASMDINKNEVITTKNVMMKRVPNEIGKIINQALHILKNAKVAVHDRLEVEISHHYGIERFDKYGAVIVNFFNREYCKKLLIMFPGQVYTIHYHTAKEETLQILYGEVMEHVGKRLLKLGEIFTIERKQYHCFSVSSDSDGAIIEEISTTYVPNDSHWCDKSINGNKSRKTRLILNNGRIE